MDLRHVRLLVADYAASYRFWAETIGLRVVFGDATTRYADFETGGAILAIFDRKHMADAVPGLVTDGTPTDRVAVILGVHSVDETYARLERDGVRVVSPPTDQPGWGIRVAHFRDPEGNLFEIFEPLAEERSD